jgi:hypothetical protein
MVIKNLIIELEKDGKRSAYISVQRRPELLAPLHHKLRVKSIVYGCHIHVYCPEMNFNNALSAGWRILYDNRNEYVHNVKIVPAYNKSKKKESSEPRCNFCGQTINK